jgi:peptide-methionine (S)-S-oxide reductase
MSRGFVSAIVGLAITIFSWFSPWAWPAWPALALISVSNTPATFAAKAAFVAASIVLNVTVWGLIAYAALRGASFMKRFAFVAFLMLAAPLHAAQAEKAIFASGCFWCTESDFEKVPGVISAVSGYIGGRVANPSYEAVSDGGTGHREAVEVTFDREKVSYQKLLDVYWHNVDPTDNDGQFCDKGTQYRSAIFTIGDAQRQQADASKAALTKKFGRIYTDILPASRFYPAEEYHQDYSKKNPVRYKYYRFSCGRDQRLKQLWGK